MNKVAILSVLTINLNQGCWQEKSFKTLKGLFVCFLGLFFVFSTRQWVFSPQHVVAYINKCDVLDSSSSAVKLILPLHNHTVLIILWYIQNDMLIMCYCWALWAVYLKLSWFVVVFNAAVNSHSPQTIIWKAVCLCISTAGKRAEEEMNYATEL